MRRIVLYMGLFLLPACAIRGKAPVPAAQQPYQMVRIDPNTLFFEGEVSAAGGAFLFDDCATGVRGAVEVSDVLLPELRRGYRRRMDQVGRAYLRFRGIAGKDSVHIVRGIDFGYGYRCPGTALVGDYRSSDNRNRGYVLQLRPDYTYALTQDGATLLSGKWGRIYRNEGVLFPDGESSAGILFMINYQIDRVILTLRLTKAQFLIMEPI